MAVTPINLSVTNITATSVRLGWELAPLIVLIRSLFGAGEQGAIYIPQPIVLGAQALFQDAAGTVPVTADGDPDGLMIDQSPNSNNAAQSVSAQRPSYRSVSGLQYLQFDGTDDALDTSLRLSAPYSYAVAITIPAGASNMYGFGGGYFVNAVEGSGVARNASGNYAVQARRDSLSSNYSGRLADDEPYIVVIQIAADGTITIDDETGQTVTSTALNNLVMGTSFALGRPEDNTAMVRDFQGKIHGALAVKGLLTATEVSDIRSYLASLSGVTL